MATKPQEVRTPFSQMAFKPDIPSQALGPSEYNSGANIESNNRGINSVYGEETILSQIPGNILYVTSGFRNYYDYWFIVVTVEGKYWGVTSGGITDLTPGSGANPNAYIPDYNENLQFTGCWNGEVVFINDTINPPFYLIPETTEFRQYGKPPDNYIWNYNPDWTNLAAGFLRLYSTPNVGSILVAGDLTATTAEGTIVRQPGTVRWSQAFGINSGPQSWAPTLTNVANELEIPCEGPAVDGFMCGQIFVVCSYWDSVLFSPLAYQSTSAPILGIRPLNLGRGLLNENCWANADNTVYGLDARDIWQFDGTNFISLGNQQVRDFLLGDGVNPGQISHTYADRTFLINNTFKNQIEIYYVENGTSHTWCNKMISYRYDLQTWNPPRDISDACMATESPVFDPDGTYNRARRNIVYAQGHTENSRLIQKDHGYQLLNGAPIAARFQRDNIPFGDYSGEVLVHRVLPEISGSAGANITITIGGSPSVGASPTYGPSQTMAVDTTQPWLQFDQNSERMIHLIANNTSNTSGFSLTAVNWQVTQVSESR